MSRRGPGRLTDRELEEIQQRSRRAWNRLVERDEELARQDLSDADAARPALRVIEGGAR